MCSVWYIRTYVHVCIYIYKIHYVIYHLQNIIFSVLLAIGLLAGGSASAWNAADIKKDHIDHIDCDRDNLSQQAENLCNDLNRIRASQAAAAVSFY